MRAPLFALALLFAAAPAPTRIFVNGVPQSARRNVDLVGAKCLDDGNTLHCSFGSSTTYLAQAQGAFVLQPTATVTLVAPWILAANHVVSCSAEGLQGNPLGTILDATSIVDGISFNVIVSNTAGLTTDSFTINCLGGSQ